MQLRVRLSRPRAVCWDRPAEKQLFEGVCVSVCTCFPEILQLLCRKKAHDGHRHNLRVWSCTRGLHGVFSFPKNLYKVCVSLPGAGSEILPLSLSGCVILDRLLPHSGVSESSCVSLMGILRGVSLHTTCV